MLSERQEALELIMTTVGALFDERGDEGKIWGSMEKPALKRQKPILMNPMRLSFVSSKLEPAGREQMLALERDERSGGYMITAVNDG